eukprot:CCRYP_019225-RA/>CCRYP_019225-RA protein AED:0.43 eAED:0.54 QI:585/0/0.5/1/0/0/2/0/94
MLWVWKFPPKTPVSYGQSERMIFNMVTKTREIYAQIAYCKFIKPVRQDVIEWYSIPNVAQGKHVFSVNFILTYQLHNPNTCCKEFLWKAELTVI